MGLGTTRPTALVTGAAGFLGSHLVDRLLAEGYEVVGLDNLMTGDLSNLKDAGRDPHFHFQMSDVREPIPVYAELVFNLACPASPQHYQSDPMATFTTSVEGAQRIVEMTRGRKCRVVHASTSEVYGSPERSPQKESYWGHVNPIGARSCYDEGKRGAETLFTIASQSQGLDVRIARIFNTYGPRMARGDGRVVSNFILQALSGRPITLYGSGEQTRSFCYVDDMIEGLMLMSKGNRMHSGPVNLGNTAEQRMKDLALLVLKLTDSPSLIEHAPLPEDDPPRRCPDLKKAMGLFDYSPHYGLEEGLSKTIDYFRRHSDHNEGTQ